MTREEAIKYLKEMKDECNDTIHNVRYVTKEEALEMAIKALEQEPSGDLISRQAVLDAFGLSEKTRKYGGDHSGYDTVMKYEIQDVLEDLPPVNPQEPKYCDRNICVSNEYNGIGCDKCEVTKSQEPKTGHWIAVVDKWGDIVTTVSGYKCSECGEFDSFRDKFCPNCGARMESEVKG